MENPPIVILTDFGDTDPYVGIMKGVITKISPRANTIDLTQGIPPGDLLKGAVVLWQSIPYFPKGTIYLCVIDPGVGSPRKGIVLETDHGFFIGPDNGLFTFLLQKKYNVWELKNQSYQLQPVTHTFHGRDIFAPAAAYLWNGVSPKDFGPSIGEPQKLPIPILRINHESIIEGEILYFDQFGNAITSIGKFHEEKDTLQFQIWIGTEGKRVIHRNSSVIRIKKNIFIPWAKSFSEIPPNHCAAIIGSSGLLEIAANRQSAERLLNLTRGESIFLINKYKNGVQHG